MDEDGFWAFIVILIAILAVSVIISIVIGIFYCLTLSKALNRCAPQNRAMSPGLVWLYLIPFFNLIWHFFIVINMAKSLHAEFVYRGIVEEPNPGQGIGLGLGGGLAKAAGFPVTFLIFGALMLLIIPFFPIIFSKRGQAA